MKDVIRFPFSLAQQEVVDWDACYAELLPKVFNYFIYKTGQTDLAEDLTASTFERVWSKRESYRSRQASMSTWIFGFARNVLKENLRASRKHVFIPLEDEITAGDPTLESNAMQNEERNWLLQMLDQISIRERDLISLKYGADLSNREIATLCHLSESNVGTILQRCLVKLKLAKEEYDGRQISL